MLNRRISLSFIAVILCCFFIESLEAEEFGTVVYTEGSVKFRRGFKTEPLITGHVLKVNDVVFSGEDGFVEITLGDANTLTLQENTRIKLELDTEEEIHWSLEEGKVRAALPQWDNRAFEIRSPSAVAGVRGTDFVAEFIPDNEDGFEVTVLEGEVQVDGFDSAKKRIKGKLLKASESIKVNKKGMLKKIQKVRSDILYHLKEKMRSRRKKVENKLKEKKGALEKLKGNIREGREGRPGAPGLKNPFEGKGDKGEQPGMKKPGDGKDGDDKKGKSKSGPGGKKPSKSRR